MFVRVLPLNFGRADSMLGKVDPVQEEDRDIPLVSAVHVSVGRCADIDQLQPATRSRQWLTQHSYRERSTGRRES